MRRARSSTDAPSTPDDVAYALALDCDGLTAFPALEQEEHDGWYFRASGGLNRRVDSATVLTPDFARLPERLEAVKTFYGARDQDPLVRLPSLWPDFEVALAAEGWRRFRPCLVLELPLDAGSETSAVAGLHEVGVEDWTAFLLRAGALKPDSEAAFRAVGERLTVPAHRFVWVDEDGRRCAAVMLVRTGRRAGVMNLVVDPQARGRGIAREMMRALTDWARGAGLSGLWLQVWEENTPAIRLYHGEGWQIRYRYWYWEPMARAT